MRKLIDASRKGAAIAEVVLSSGALWRPALLGRLRAVNTLFAPDRIVRNFSNMDTMFETLTMSRGDAAVSPLPQGPAMPCPDGMEDWITRRSLTALVVLKDGKVRHESYFQGTGPQDRRISWSVAKSWLSALVGILLEDGTFALEDAVSDHVPALRGTAYDGVSLQHVMQMSSGVTFNEDYLDFHSDINRMGRVLALGRSMDGFAAGLQQRWTHPGAEWLYVSIDTHVIGMVVQAVTGRPVHEVMQERLIAPMGLEADTYFVADGHGTAFVLGGLNMRTRDYARFGQMILQGGQWQGRQVVPEAWIKRSTCASAPTAAGEEKYGLQWWIAPDATDGEFFARGIYGQYVYIDPARAVVIAANGTDCLFREDGVVAENVSMFRKIARTISSEQG